MPSKNSRQISIKTCPRCYAEVKNPDECHICQYPLQGNHLKPTISSSTTLARSGQKIFDFSRNHLGTFKRDLTQPSALLGLAAITFSVVLWGNYLLANDNETKRVDQPKLRSYQTLERVENVPEGLFSYGGSAYFAPLVAQGLNKAIAKAHPEFQLRYSEPPILPTPYSTSAEGIRMLIEGEISFAYSSRPLNPEEYRAARGRGISLKQVPIALDGVVIFTNSGIGVSALGLDRVREIFSGKITNWNQLGATDLPIVPVLLSEEELEVLGVELRSCTSSDKVQNHADITKKKSTRI